MNNESFQSVTDQVTDALRSGMLEGRWRDTLPSRHQLADELGVNHKTVEAAAQRLIKEGWLVAQKPPLRRRIVLPKGVAGKQRNFRIQILNYQSSSRGTLHLLMLLDQLGRSGVTVDIARKSLRDLGMDPKRVADYVAHIEADAWIVESASNEVLEWFSSQELPTLAIFGRFSGLPIAAASPRYAPAIVQATQRLFELGHRRIVMLVREERRSPRPAIVEQAFLDTLESLGIQTGDYNLPHWQNDAYGLRDCLKSLFSHTPPTALILGDTDFVAPVQQYLSRRGFHAPEQFSLICPSIEPAYGWCDPPLSHFHWDPQQLVRRVRTWAKNLANGREDTRHRLFDTEFVETGSIGPVPKN